jgi:Na+-driven multidrug efflux pump
MIAGFTGNTVLNYFLIWILKTGVSGAATSTLIGQSITAVGGLLYLWKKKIPVLGICLDTRRMIRIMKVGVSSFGITLCPNISLFLMNRFLMSYGGNAMVACYAVISYGTMIVYLLLQGVGDGCQPLLSDCYGRREEKQLHFLQRMAYITAEGIAVFCLLSLYLTRGYLGMLFGASKEVCSLVETNMPIILIGFLFLAVARVATAGFYATEQSGKAILLVYSEVIFLFLFLLIFPRLFGTVAVWVSMLGAQIMACICAVILLKIQ